MTTAKAVVPAHMRDVFGTEQPHIPALMRNRAGNFSIVPLMEFLTGLGQDVEITMKSTRKARGEMEVVVRRGDLGKVSP